MVDIIERDDKNGNREAKSKFNWNLLYNPKGVTLDEALEPFTSKIMQLREFVTDIQNGVDQTVTSPKVTWWFEPKSYDETLLREQVLRRLRNQPISPDYKELTRQQVDDIITCAGTLFFRAEYSLNFEYIDFPKGQNFNAFGSGIFCFFPPVEYYNVYVDPDMTFYNYSARAQQFFKEHHPKAAEEYKRLNLDEHTAEAAEYKRRHNGDPPYCPPWVDARCRDWYVDQYDQPHETMTPLYPFLNSATSQQGISICAPLWGRLHPDKYYGAYCIDIYPASKTGNFL